ncbi:polysaccharide biosynthesis/export family protein [Acidobacteriota bacterium]
MDKLNVLLTAAILVCLISPVQATEYRIGIDDIIDIDVLKHPEFHSVGKVNYEGYFKMNIVGQLKISGMTVREVDILITRILAKDYLKDPKVIVSIKDFENMKVYLFGHVQMAGVQELEGPTNLLELLALAGGVTEEGGTKITIERKRSYSSSSGKENVENGVEPETIVIDLKKLLQDGDLSQNIPLKNGDKIYVPGALSQGQIYIFGEVNRPGYYPYRSGMNLYDAIKQAGGFGEFANQKSIKIKRKISKDSDEREVLKINLKKMLKQGDLERNVPIQPDDIVVVPSSFFF